MAIILLAGGSGSRLWPLSNSLYPKQFIHLPSLGLSSFQLALNRTLKKNPDIIITCNHKHEDLVKQQIIELDLNPKDFQIIREEKNLNTAMAIYNTCHTLLKQNNDDLAYFLPTDHIIEQDDIFTNLNQIDHDKINLLGEKVAHACSDFGYLIKGKELSEKYFQIERFIEKPENPNQLNGKDIYKNLGIYIAKPSCLHNEFHNLYPTNFPQNLSIDKMITEKSKNLNAFEVNFKWTDIGSISNLYKQFEDSIFSINNLDINDINSFNEESKEFEMNYDGTFLQITKKPQYAT